MVSLCIPPRCPLIFAFAGLISINTITHVQVNNTLASALNIHEKGAFQDVAWKDVKVGM